MSANPTRIITTMMDVSRDAISQFTGNRSAIVTIEYIVIAAGVAGFLAISGPVPGYGVDARSTGSAVQLQ